MFDVKMIDQFSNDFCISFALEFEALVLKEDLDLLVIRDDPIVDHDERIGVVRAMWMRIDFAGHPVGGPPGVGDAAVDLGYVVDAQTRATCRW